MDSTNDDPRLETWPLGAWAASNLGETVGSSRIPATLKPPCPACSTQRPGSETAATAAMSAAALAAASMPTTPLFGLIVAASDAFRHCFSIL